MGQDSDCNTFAPEGRGRDSHSNCSMPVVPSLNLIPDGDGGDSNVDHNNDDKEDGDDDFFPHGIVRQVCLLRSVR